MKDKIIVSASHRGIIRAVFENGKWITSRAMEGKDIRCLSPHKVSKDLVYAGTQGHGIYVSEDRGKNWHYLGLKNQIVKSIVTGRARPEIIYAGVKPANIFRSEDSGRSWRELEGFRRMPEALSWFSPAEPPFTAYVLGIDISPVNENEIIAGIEFGGVHLSLDGGKTWQGHMQGAIRDCHNLMYHLTRGNYVYEAGGVDSGAAISRDGGLTWNQSREGLDRNYGWAVAADPDDPELWYASFSTSPMRAHSGKHAQACVYKKIKDQPWMKLRGGLPDEFSSMPYSLITTTQPGFIAAGLSNGNIWQSWDYGDNWEQVNINMGISKTMILIG